MRRKKTGVRLLISGATVLVVLLLVELGLRLGGYDPLARIRTGRAMVLRPSDHPDLSYELDPGSEAIFRGNLLRVNSAGFRDHEYERAKPAGVERVAVVGDSIPYGFGMALEEVFAKQLEELCAAEGMSVEVLNFGVGGYDVLDAVCMLEDLALEFDPDRVVHAFCINDVGVQSYNLPFIETLKRYGFWTRNSRLVQLLTLRIDTAQAARDYNSWNKEDVFRERNLDYLVPIAADDPVRERMRRVKELREAAEIKLPFLDWYTSEVRVAKLRYALERLARLARERGFQATLVVVPYLNEKGHGTAYRAAYELVQAEARRAGLSTLDIYEAFASAGLRETGMHPGERFDPLHPNELGHGLIARALFDTLWGE